jgi:uncharacterized protein YndB with AHSA1/START domain
VSERANGLTLHLERVVRGSPERAFAACVEPEELATWWGPAGFTSPSVDLDVRAGGTYRIAMQPPEGELFHLSGRFLEVDAPTLLTYTFVWEEPDPDDRETVVRLTFAPVGDGTRIVLDHGRFATEARYELHRDGWTEALDRLAAFLVSR